MKNEDKIKRLEILLQGDMLGANLELQQMTELLEKTIEEREHNAVDRYSEIEDVAGTVDSSVLETAIEKISDIEEEIQYTLGLNAKSLNLDEILSLNRKIDSYNGKREKANLFEEIVEGINKSGNDKKIYAYDTVLEEFHELKYDEEYYWLLSKLVIVVNNSSLLYLKNGLHHYDDLLHFVFDKDYTCFIVRKNDDFYDIRKENLEFVDMKIDEMKKEIDKTKDEIKMPNKKEVEKTLNYMLKNKAEEIENLLSESEKILGKTIEELMEENDNGDSNDDK